MKVKWFLDTNIFMYAAGEEHPLKAPCVGILRQVAEEALEAVTSTEVLQEILYRYGALGEIQRGLRIARLAVDQVGGAVLPVTVRDMQEAFGLLERHGKAIAVRDAIHAATMLNNGLTHLLSADTHFDVITGITRTDPRRANQR